MFVSEFIYLEYSQVFASLISGIITFNLIPNNDRVLEYLPLQICFDLLEKIASNSQYNLYLIDREFTDKIDILNESEMTIALFPLILYHSQNITQLEADLDLLTQNSSIEPKQLDTIKIYIALVILIIEKKLVNARIIIAIQDKLEEIKEERSIFSNLELINELVDNKSTLIEVEEQLSKIIEPENLAIYQALYSFLSLPDNLPISLQRSSQFKKYPRETAILTGFLLGLKNGCLAIPYQWRKTIEQETITSKIDILSNKLVAKWQGKLI